MAGQYAQGARVSLGHTLYTREREPAAPRRPRSRHNTDSPPPTKRLGPDESRTAMVSAHALGSREAQKCGWNGF